MKTLNEIVQNTKNILKSTFFKVVKDGDAFIIKEYFGPAKTAQEMHYAGWHQFNSILNEINESYPLFNLKDFKAIDENTIVKKTEQDYLEDELKIYIKYLEYSDSLYKAIKILKDLLSALSINPMNYNKFSDLQNSLITLLNNNRLDGSKYLMIFSNNINEVYLQLEKINVKSPRNLFNEKFKFFFALIK